MANQERGEINLTLGGKEYVLRPTFEALCEMEDRLGITITDLIMEFAAGKVSIKKVGTVVWAGIYGSMGDKAPTLREVGDMLVKDGMMTVITQGGTNGTNKTNSLSQFLIQAIGADEPARDKGKKAEKHA